MKVLHASPSYARSDGGPSEVLRQLIPAQSAAGAEVSLVSTTKGLIPNEEPPEGLASLTCARSIGPARLNLANRARQFVEMAAHEADVVHIHGIFNAFSSSAMTACRAMAKPFVVEPHGSLDEYHMRDSSMLKRVWLRSIDRKNFLESRAFIYSTTYEAAHPAAVRLGRGRIMPLGVDPELITESPRQPPATPNVLFLGRITAKKRIDLVIDALGQLRQQGHVFTFTVAGPTDASLGFDVPELLERASLLECTAVIGQVTASMRAETLRRATVFVLPSDDESFGIAAAEAMAAGVPTVLTRTVGIATDAARAGAAFCVEQRADNLAAAIEQTFDEAAWREVSQAARRYASREFDWSNIASRSLEIYNEAL